MAGPRSICATCSTAIAVDPGRLIAYLSDPTNLPQWAPAFAVQATPADDGTWIVQSPDGKRRVAVRTSVEHGVVDFLSAEGPQAGAFLRVLPSGGVSHVTFTILFPGGATPESVKAEMESAAQELVSLRQLLEEAK
jgi:hypothetical protein